MKETSLMRIRLTLAFASLALACLPAVQAQQNNTPPASQKKAQPGTPPAFNPFGPNSPLGGAMAPLMMSFGSMFGGTVDLSHSNAMTLLQRNDVRSELLLTAQQKEKMDGMKATSQQDLIQRVMSSGVGENFQGIQNAPQEQQLGLVQDGLAKLNDTVQAFHNDQVKDIEKLLDRKATGGIDQGERLRQLDLQFRGPMALSEKKLADALKLTPEQNTKVTKALNEYVQVQGEAMMKAFSGLAAGGFNPGAGGRPGGGDPQQMQKDLQKKMTEAMQSDDLKKARKASEKTVLDALTPEQKETWNSWLGKPFTFRATAD
jgi:hypothetical protein